MYTLDKDLVYQPSLDCYLADHLHKIHSMSTNLQELDLQLQQLGTQIEKGRARKKAMDDQRDAKAAEEDAEELK